MEASGEHSGLDGRAGVVALVLAIVGGALALCRVDGLEAWFAFRLVATSALLACVGGAAASRISRRARLAPAALLGVALGAAAPFIGALALHAFARPLIAAAWWAEEGVRTDSATLAVLGTSAVASAIGAALIVAARGPAAVWGPAAATLAVAACGTLLVGSALRLGAPEPSEYIGTLPVAGAVPPANGPPTRTVAGAPWSWEPSRIYETQLGDVLVTRVCENHVCGVVIGHRHPGEGLWGPDAATSLAASTLVVRRDERHGLWVFSEDGGARVLRDGKAVALRVEDVADAARPPLSWIGASAVGLVAAGLLLVSVRRRARAAKAIRDGIPGTLGDDGWISFDEPLAAVRAPQAQRPGPVVMLSTRPAGARLYRGDEAGRVLEGSRADLLAAVDALRSRRAVFALALALVTTAPLAAAYWTGLVL